MHLNFVVQDDLNDRRKALGVTWRELLIMGLTSLEGNPRIKDPAPVKIPESIDQSTLEGQLMILVKGSKAQHDAVAKVWKLLKPLFKKGSDGR